MPSDDPTEVTPSTAGTPATPDDPYQRIERELVAARTALAGQSRFLEATLSSIPDFVYAFDRDRRFVYVNRAMQKLFGLTAAEMMGKNFADLAYPPDLAARLHRHLDHIFRSGETLEDEVFYTSPIGISGYFEFVWGPVRAEDGTVELVVGVSRDTTERQRLEEKLRASEKRQAFLLQLSDTLRPLADPAEVQLAAVRLLGEHLGASRAGYAEDQGDGETVVVTRHYTTEVLSLEGPYRYDDYGPTLARELRAGRTVVRPDVAHDPTLTEEEKHAHAALQLGATVNVPLVKAGRLVAILFVHYANAHEFSPAELALTEEVADRTWAAVARARAEKALRESESRLALVFDLLPVGVGLANATGALFLSNQEMHRYVPTGHMPSQDDQRRWRWHAYDADGHSIQPYDFPGARVLRGERVSPGIEMLYTQDDGTEIWTRVAAVPTRDDEGRVTGGVAVVTDIDTLKRTAEALRASERGFRLLIDNVREYALFQTDLQGVVTSWNPGGERLFGYTQTEMLGQSAACLLTPEDQASRVLEQELSRVLSGQHQEDARWLVRKDGSRFWAQWICELVRDESGQLLGVAKVLRDETERQHAAEALRERETRISAIFDQAAVGLSEVSLDGCFLRVNQELCRILGRTRDELLRIGVPEVTSSDHFEHSLACVREAIETVRPVSIDKQYRRPDGTLVWANSVVTPLTDERGHPRTLLVVTVDLTERQRAAEALHVSLAEKQELLKEVHHRVKNNLQVIVSLITMQTLQIGDERILALFEEMRNRVLAISSIHELLYRAESFASIGLIEYARQLAPGLVRFYGLEQRIGLEILGDRATLELERAVPFGMLLNELVSNACKHAFPSPWTGVITISVRPEGTAIELVVADTGQGLPKEFNYHQTSSIGLTLVHALVRQLRGAIDVQSASGTTVRVQFPAKAETEGNEE